MRPQEQAGLGSFLDFCHFGANDRGRASKRVLDAGVPVHTVAARYGRDPAVLLRAYAERTARSDAWATQIIEALSQGVQVTTSTEA